MASCPPSSPPSSRSFFLGTSNVSVHEAARATTAAPTYYQPFAIGGQRMVGRSGRVLLAGALLPPHRFMQADGAIIANNPVLIALCEAELLWPGAPVEVVLSLGTGTQARGLSRESGRPRHKQRGCPGWRRHPLSRV